ncbi:S1C family serine protease [Actinoplanes sp. N902-109]|uniref:S1C family serine protease n=1 Tax=Actinoplanes sp. (strain N902-109) TaxID=649831 RepID=UPI00032947C9|nr:trypsin-like peptidase domain-containing protein [Actinoplanes sp. N902-109]AGL20183.1 peptidase S1 and S6 chymotrypsin/Hap [Actinoplanes sp. N902-109]
MTTAYDPFGGPGQRRPPQDPLLSLPDHPSGEWATAARPSAPPPRIGHPRPARRDAGPYLVSPTGGAPYPVVSEPIDPPRRSRLVPLLLAVVLLAGGGFMAWRLERADSRLTGQLAASQQREGQLADRAEKLEKQLAGVFDPEAISSAVLPSVFRVRAGNFTGTAFSFGAAEEKQSYLFTNFHVVESVWDAGTKKVFLERGKDEVDATIVKVDKKKDIALLRTTKQIAGLAVAEDVVKPGQQVVVVGSPLGLEDTVTTGVVSAYRPDDTGGPSIQFDAPINPGNSGGPVVNASNEVIGLATAKARDAEGIGLAIPIKTACDAFDAC